MRFDQSSNFDAVQYLDLSIIKTYMRHLQAHIANMRPACKPNVVHVFILWTPLVFANNACVIIAWLSQPCGAARRLSPIAIAPPAAHRQMHPVSDAEIVQDFSCHWGPMYKDPFWGRDFLLPNRVDQAEFEA